MTINAVILLLLLNVVHWLADYSHLSTTWMLNAKRYGKPLLPILVHSGVHAILMGITMTILGYGNCFRGFDIVGKLMFFQLITHFLIDVWKGKMNVWFPSLCKQENKWHWVVFGFDQIMHEAVIILMAYILLNNYI